MGFLPWINFMAPPYPLNWSVTVFLPIQVPTYAYMRSPLPLQTSTRLRSLGRPSSSRSRPSWSAWTKQGTWPSPRAPLLGTPFLLYGIATGPKDHTNIRLKARGFQKPGFVGSLCFCGLLGPYLKAHHPIPRCGSRFA